VKKFLSFFFIFVSFWSSIHPINPDLKKPIFEFGWEDLKAGKNNYLQCDWERILDALIAADGIVYLLDYSGYIWAIDRNKREVKKFAKKGNGPGELMFASNFDIVHEELWVANTMNGRIEIFNRNGKPLESPQKLINIPISIAFSKGIIGVASADVSNELNSKGIVFFEKSGKVVSWLKPEIPEKYSKYKSSKWFMGILRGTEDGKFFFGLKFIPVCFLIDPQNNKIETIILDNLFKIYGEAQTSPDSIPLGFAMYNFCAGPESSLFLITCQPYPQRICNSIIQYSIQQKKIIHRFDFSEHICVVKYNFQRRELLVIFKEWGSIYQL